MPLSDTQRSVLLGRARELLQKREWPKTICPSEVARTLSREELDMLNAQGWRDTMGDIRETVWVMRDSGEVDVLQKGHVLGDTLGLDHVHGPIRIRAKQK